MKKSFLSYLGGKSLLADKIISKMPPHTCYCEVFAGAAWVLFKKDPSKVEVINDINKDLITLYRVIQRFLEPFAKEFRWVLISRDEFERRKKEDPSTLLDIERAARFYYVIRNGFSSLLVNPAFSTQANRKPRLNLLRLEEELSAAHLRLARVTVENLHYADLIPRYDKPETFFYIDPPYYGIEGYYGKGIFSRDDYDRLHDILAGIKGNFLMSLNDTKEVRRIFKDFRISTVKHTYSSSPKGKRPCHELFISNYTPPRRARKRVAV